MCQVCPTVVHAFGMRIAVAPLTVLVMVAAALTACAPDPAEIAACRQQFADYQQKLGENGNPGRKEFTPKMTARWQVDYAEFGELGKSATADDCPERFDAKVKGVKSLEAVLYKIDDYDVDRMISRAEQDLEHAEKVRGAPIRDYVLQGLFARLRQSGAEAQEAFAPLVARADSATGQKRGEAMVALYNAAASNAAFADFKDALSTIEDYEFNEE